MNPFTNMYGIQKIGDDTGQLYHPPTNVEDNTCSQQKESANLVQNSSNYADVTHTPPYQSVNLQVLPTLKPVPPNNKNDKQEKVLKILIEKRFYENKDTNTNELSTNTIQSVISLATHWINDKNVTGICPLNNENTLIQNTIGLQDLDKWLLPPRVIKTKKQTKVELMLAVYTTYTAYQLYKHQSKIFETENMKISTKRTIMQYTKRIGFLTGPYVQLASVQEYEQQLYDVLNIEKGAIEIKKELIYESGAKTKALVLYAVENRAKELDAQLYSNQQKNFKYVSFKIAPSSYRLGAMQMNEWVNMKARFEILYNADKNEIVTKDGIQESLQSCLLKQEHNETKLFLAIENGSGKEQNNALVVINPAKKYQARKWIVEEYPAIIYKDERNNETSINTEEFQSNIKYNEDLKDFLTPILTQKGIEKIGSFGKSKYKTYASVVGIETKKKPASMKASNNQKTKKDQKTNESENDLKKMIQHLQNTIQNMAKAMMEICEEIVKEPRRKEHLMQRIQEFTQNNQKQEQEEQYEGQQQDENIKQKQPTQKRQVTFSINEEQQNQENQKNQETYKEKDESITGNANQILQWVTKNNNEEQNAQKRRKPNA